MRILISICFSVLFFPGYGQYDLLKAGPMTGCAVDGKINVWLQTASAKSVMVCYRKEEDSSFTCISSETRKENHFVCKIALSDLRPSSSYVYNLFVNDSLVNPGYYYRFETYGGNKLKKELTIALGSCTYVSGDEKNIREETLIFSSIQKLKPDVMLWMGDNIYLGESDLIDTVRIYQRYDQYRAFHALKDFQMQMSNLAVWDDHDYAGNNSDCTFVNKKASLNAFRNYWPQDDQMRVSLGAVDIFLLDNRYYRSPAKFKNNLRQIFGRQQIDILLEELEKSQATFKLIASGGQILCIGRYNESYNIYKKEKAYLLKEIALRKIEGVFFLSGDRHFTELTKLQRKNDYPLYDLTVSPLTSDPQKRKSPNKLREKGTFVNERNFGLLRFFEKESEVIMIIEIYNAAGEMKWSRVMTGEDLK
ncbi:MAG: alkaline phosphatase D family protein [Cytophagaceae bacterium]